MTFSMQVMSGNSLMFWKVRAMPALTIRWASSRDWAPLEDHLALLGL
jgi:hypothetical protein